MRILEGRWAGEDLVSPGGRVRPTAEAVRAASMRLLGEALQGARVLDLFAGTGALGLEALSRGARRCDFVENGPAAMHSLRANIARLRTRERARVFDRDAIPFVERLPAGCYDIAFADPPWGSRKLDRIMKRWLEVPFSRLLLLEHAPDHTFAARPLKRKLEGDAALSLFRAPAPPRTERWRPRGNGPKL